jgi:cytochrome c553
MKAVHLRVALKSALAVFMFASAGQAMAKMRHHPEYMGGVNAKFEYCRTCHGMEGQGFRGYYVMPRLAGQRPEYIMNQLRAFQERRRVNPVMANVAHGIPPGMAPTLAARFHALNPAPYGGGPTGSVALGRQIFATGIPQQNVPACSACHGKTAMGNGPIPRLAGQLYWYVVQTLEIWGTERGRGLHKDISAIMLPTTHNLTHAQIRAIAEYVSRLR